MGQPERPASIPPATDTSRFGIRPSGVEYHDLVEQAKRALANTRFTPTNEPLLALSITSEIEPEVPEEPQYATIWGQITFADLYRRTQRVAGAVMVNAHGMTNPEDVDDCLQAGYLKVWQRLQNEPDWLVDKPKRYIVQAVVLHSKSQRFSHNRHYRKLVYDAEPHAVSGLAHIPQLETWIDLQQALTQVATAIEDQPALLLAFHSLITHTPVEEISTTSGYAKGTLYGHRRVVRRALASALPEYGQQPEETSIPLDMKAKPQVMVSDYLLSDVPIYKLDAALDQEIRQAITTAQPPEHHYATHWQERQTFEQIILHPVVRRAAYAKAYQLGLEDEDVEDCVQQGYIKLWERLSKQPDLLADKGPVWAGIYIAYSGNPRGFHRHYQKRRRFADPDFDWDIADEHLQIGIPVNRSLEWMQVVDEEIDIARFMHLMATHYAHDTRKLLALYALTTSVRTKDVASILGIHEKNYATAVGNRVKKVVQEQSKDYFLLSDPVNR